ncbi:hypothetical protein [Pseudoneobacillus rhizosphaerae]|jgi:hypothetical protein|uniref:Sodium:proton antiporter n=1 Tax=Pseudoneobacillus rhizosphaerae TaxID=2880968 RepID=A0A9C7GBW2_9BACI|nr:hypothetical protein [Pseudoneobacillus rhizosphaerae]CAG9609370.1 hypothetical protein NEOCIP111885_03112 [Pseudoneobacillus rhizosphaerae]
MTKLFSSIIMIGTLGYTLYRYRYRLMNLVLGTGYLRRVLVRSMMSLPGIRKRMMSVVFNGPSNW